MKIAIPMHFIRAGRVGGAEQAIYNLVQGFAELGTTMELLVSRTDRLAPEFLSAVGGWENCSLVEVGFFGNRFLAEQVAPISRKASYDMIVFPNYYTPFVVPERCGRVVTVVYDLRYKHFPSLTSWRKRRWLDQALRRTFRRADTVVVSSNATARDGVRFFGEAVRNKTKVIPVAVTWTDGNAVEADHPLGGEHYILSVAHNWAHKNLATLVKAFKSLSHSFPSLRLVLVGQMFDDVTAKHEQGVTDIPGLIRDLALTDRVLCTGYVTDEMLSRYYRHATVFAFPSLFEGFGLPVVEAIGYGVPALAARLEPMTETSMGHCIWVEDHQDPEAWAGILRKVIADPAAFRPTQETQAEIRQAHSTKRIADMFLEPAR